MGDEKCNKRLPEPGAFHFRFCSRDGVVERNGKWWCRQHDPEVVKARRQKSADESTRKYRERKADAAAAVLRDPRVVALRRALGSVEWIEDCPDCGDGEVCPDCEFSHGHGHASDCKLAAALAAAKPEEVAGG